MHETDFICEYKKELVEFYSPYFTYEFELEEFLTDTFDYEYGSFEVRQMIFQVQRFVSLAEDIDIIRPGRDSLKITFLKTGLESLFFLSGYNKKQKKQFFENFCGFFSDKGKKYILDNFKLSNFEDEYKGLVFDACHNMELIDFLNIMKATRDFVVHDGEYWGMDFFTDDEDIITVATMETEIELLSTYKYLRTKKFKTTYIFDTTLNYEKFIFYFVEACVNFIKDFKKSTNLNLTDKKQDFKCERGAL